MKKLRELIAILAIMATGVAMTGCGSDDDGGGGGGGGGAAAPATRAAFESGGGVWYLVPGTGENAGQTYAITFAGGSYSVTFPGENTPTTGTYAYTVDTNNPHRAHVTLNEPEGTTLAVLDFSAENAGTYSAVFTPTGGAAEPAEQGTFGRTNPNPGNGGGDPTNTNGNGGVDTNTNTNPGTLNLVGRRVQVVYGTTAGSPQELFEFRSDNTFGSDFEPGAGGTYTISQSGNSATVQITYTAPAHANGDTGTYNFTSTSENGGDYTATVVYGGNQQSFAGPWSFAQ